MEDKVEIIDTYNKDGFWIKRTIDDMPVFIPEEFKEKPMVQIFDIQDCEWFMSKKTMTKEEAKQLYPNLLK